jgi:hypothetical protein
VTVFTGFERGTDFPEIKHADNGKFHGGGQGLHWAVGPKGKKKKKKHADVTVK